ncbi:TetR/AcrR family transcriptional regulator [Sphingobium boeckii]|uniref:TetR/AcrR family transcriptional repressor for divergent bdcA n=1 Tax=Sphingobium boeckii TaxID=1082345 RepID=A0A7W9AET1_9SPHN|nr:TetR/AcrR family transcriptional regulator [Sphingobium boeckii]MBB5684129.1 TetR/AcrR family transcriptional repressor for divergent bdcA [Sphingobium boeckii]
MTTKTSPRGRPRSFDKDAAIATAQQLFHEHGYDGVSVANLGTAMGIKPPSFYSAFGSKAGLFAEVIARYADTEGRFTTEALAGDGRVVDGIERLLLTAAHIYARQGMKSGCLVLDSTRNSSDIEARTITGGMTDRSRAMVEDYIARDYPDRARTLSEMVMIAMKGMSSAARDNASAASLENFALMAASGFRHEVAQNARNA